MGTYGGGVWGVGGGGVEELGKVRTEFRSCAAGRLWGPLATSFLFGHRLLPSTRLSVCTAGITHHVTSGRRVSQACCHRCDLCPVQGSFP